MSLKARRRRLRRGRAEDVVSREPQSNAAKKRHSEETAAVLQLYGCLVSRISAQSVGARTRWIDSEIGVWLPSHRSVAT